MNTDRGERAIPNPNSGLIWEYTGEDVNGDNKIDFEETMHRTMANVVIHNGLLVAADFTGIVHCLDARSGDSHWTFDPLSQTPASPLIVDDTVYVGTEEGAVLLFRLSRDPGEALRNDNGELAPLAAISTQTAVFVSPAFANGVLYVTNRSTLYALQESPHKRVNAMFRQRFLCCGSLSLVVIAFAIGHGRAADWPAFGRDHTRNAVSPETDPPTDWDIETGRNIKWQAEIASAAFGAPVISDGLVWVGGNSWRARNDLPRDAALLLCFDEQTGEKLYEFASPRLGWTLDGDPPWHGLGSSPLIEGDRLWFVTNRCETVCLDIAPLKAEPRGEPRVVWNVDMLGEFGVSPKQPFMGPSRLCSIAPSYQGLIFVSTGNGVDNSHANIPAPDAPGLICFDKSTGEAKWQVPTGVNVLLSEVSSPLVADIAGRGQVVMPHGDGWVRSYDPHTGRLLWEFDSNLKEAVFTVRGRCARNYFLSTPVLYEDRIYIANGNQPVRGDGPGRLVCIDPSGSGDISAELAVDANGNVIAPRRLQCVDPNAGERAILNPNSGLVWDYTGVDVNDNGKIDYEERMHRSVGSVVIHGGLLLNSDFGEIVRCLDPRTGKPLWTYDTFSRAWSSPLIVDDVLYMGTDNGTVLLLHVSEDGPNSEIADIDLEAPIYAAPVFANGVLYITTRNTLYAIQTDATRRIVDDRTRQPGNTHMIRLACRSLSLALVVLAAAVSLPADEPAGHWPQYFGPARDNISTETGLLGEWPDEGPPLVWKINGLGTGMAPVSVADGRIFTVGNRDGNDVLVALDEATGDELWTLTLAADIPAIRGMRWLNQRAPTVDGDHVYAVSAAGDLACVEVDSGRELWRLNYAEDFGGTRPVYGWCDHPLVDGERLICAPNSETAVQVAVNKLTGHVLWSCAAPSWERPLALGPITGKFLSRGF